MKSEAEESTLNAGAGVELMVSRNQVANPRAILVVVHGMCEHSGRYGHVTERFNDFGYSVYRFDNRGHGRSGGDRGFIQDYNIFIDDADKVVSKAGRENGGVPMFMLGHSMGGFITAAYGVKYPDRLAGQVLSGASVIVLPAIKGLESFDYNADARTPIPNTLANSISRDPKVIEAYLQDPLVLKEFTTKLMGEFLIRGAKLLMENMAEYRYPCLILHGGSDQIVTPEASKYLYDHIASKDKQIKIYEGLFHEILNEPEKETVIEDIHAWIEAHI
jgi:acylglycerol lipase